MTAPFITIAPGPRNAYTSETGLRFYRWKGIDYPSVTTIRRMAGLPFMLHQWTLSQVINRAIDQNGDLNRILSRTDPEVAKAAKTWLRQAAVEERDRAASLGTRVHDAAAAGRAIGEVSPDVSPFLRQYYHWQQTMGFDVIASEQQVFNLTLGYGGTFDLLGKLPSRKVWVVDLKTGKGTYPEHALQGLAYGNAEFVGADDVIDENLTRHLASAEGIALLHLRPEGWTWQALHLDEAMREAFIGLLAFAKWAHDHPDMTNLLSDERTGAD